MIKPKNKKQAIKVFELIEQRVRAQVMARLKPFGPRLGPKEHLDYFSIALKLDDDLLKELYGTASLVDLGYRFGLLSDEDFKPKAKPKKKKVLKKRKKFKRTLFDD